MASPVERSHVFRVLSSDAETAMLLSEITATPLTGEVCPSRVWTTRQVERSHTFSVLSEDADTAKSTSFLLATATPFTPEPCPSSVWTTFPVERSHTFKVWSEDAETIRWSFDVSATP